MKLPWIAELLRFLRRQPKQVQDLSVPVDLAGAPLHFITLGGGTVTVEGIKIGVRHLSLQLWQVGGNGLPHIGIELSDREMVKSKAHHLSTIELQVDTGWQGWTWSVDKAAGGNRTWQCKNLWVSYLSLGLQKASLDGACKAAVHLVVFVGAKAAAEEQWNALVKLGQEYAFLEQPGYAADELGQSFRNWPRSYYVTEPLAMAAANNSNTFIRYLLAKTGLPRQEPSGIYPGAIMPTTEVIDGPTWNAWVYEAQPPFKRDLAKGDWPPSPLHSPLQV